MHRAGVVVKGLLGPGSRGVFCKETEKQAEVQFQTDGAGGHVS